MTQVLSKTRVSIRWNRLCGLWITALLCVLQAQIAHAQPLSSSQFTAQRPQIVALANGDCSVVWQEISNNSSNPVSRIIVRSKVSGVWQTRHSVVSVNRSDALVTAAILTQDKNKNLHLAWILRQAETDRIQYSRQQDGQWTAPILIGAVSNFSLSELQISTTGNAGIFLTWQENDGSDYRIHTARIDASGQTNSIVAGESEMRSVIFPAFYQQKNSSTFSALQLCWFDLDQSDDPVLSRMRWNPEQKKWAALTSPDWDTSLLRSFPLIVSSPDAEPYLIGIQAIKNYDRIFLQSSHHKFWLDRTPLVQNAFPRVSAPDNDGMLGIVWQQESERRRWIMQAAVDPANGLIYAQPLDEPDAFLDADPQYIADCALSKNHLLSVRVALIEHSPNIAPTQQIVFSKLSLDDSVQWTLLPIAGDSE